MSELQNQLEELAYLKQEIKSLEERASELQTTILENPEYDREPVQTPFGKLSLTSRTNYSTPDNSAVIQEIGLERFKSVAKVSVSDLKKIGGDNLIGKLLSISGTAFVKKSDTVFFTLRESNPWGKVPK